MTAPSLERGQVGPYEIIAEISSGGMGSVLLVRKTGVHGFERLLALKTIRSDLQGAGRFREMFLDEARLLAQITHPCVAQVYDFGEDSSCLYLVMEYVAGVPFGDLNRGAGAVLPPGVLARAVAQAARGLHAAHTLAGNDGQPLGVVHRDISPQNLILGFEGRVKVIDFGIAKRRGRATPDTEIGNIKGKPAYLSPEQWHQLPADPRSDIYSLALVMYECLVGEKVFKGRSLLEVAQERVSTTIVPPSNRVASLPRGLDPILMRALATDKAERYPSADAFADALEALANEHQAPSVEAVCAQEFLDHRRQHTQWLKEIIAAADRGEHAVELPRLAAAGPATELETALTVPPPEQREPGRRRARWWIRGFAALVVVIGSLLGVEHFTGALRLFDAGADPPGQGPTAQVDPPKSEEASRVDDAGSNDRVRPATSNRRRNRRSERESPPRTKRSATVAKVRKKTASPPGLGYLRVKSQPWGHVFIDGALVGSTPLLRHPLPSGSHIVEIRSPETGEVRKRQAIEIRHDEIEVVSALP